jgi:glycosyltransferase involved in cell wall biosynthesis
VVAVSLLVDAAWWLAALTLVVGWTVLLLNALTFRRLDDDLRRAQAPAPDASTVSILVPARDEEATLPHTLPALLAQGAGEVVVLDDASSDGTAAVVEALAAGAPRLRLLRGAPLPEGWSGKNWACHQLARAARGDRLVFTDADVTWEPRALEALLRAQERGSGDLVTAWPRQRCVTLGERLVVPLVDMLLLTTLPAALAERGGPASMTGANGQCMLWRRGAYDAVGGHEAVRGEVLEDVRLAQRAKARGLRVVLRLGGTRLLTRMYRGYAGVVRGFGKNALASVANRPWALVALALLNLVTYALPWPLLLVDGRWWPIAIGGVGLRAASNALSLRPLAEAPLQPLGPLALLPVVALALRWNGRYEWRGRRYG